MKNSMMLVNSSWQEEPNFRLIPISEECPYVECIFDPTTKVFVIISKLKKNSMHMLPKLDDSGDPMFLKGSKRVNGKVIKEERKMLETFQEYYLDNLSDVEFLIKHFAVNDDSFDYKSILEKPVKVETPLIYEQPKPEIILSSK